MIGRILMVSILIFSIALIGSAQGTLRGKIVDDNGEDMIGVTIVYQDDTGTGTITDYDGTYSFPIADKAVHIIEISYVGYTSIVDAIQLFNNEIQLRDYTLTTGLALAEVEVVERADRSANYFMENIKRKSATTLDYMPADLMKKVGDSDVSSAIARVSGVSTNGGFFSVRGISDRYVRTTVNGSIIPTLDPFTNNVKLDLFPTSLVDNIVITKTQSSDLPGDWSAAYISVETKDYPTQLSVNISSSVGYNPQSSFQNVLTNEVSETDWLGYDNGFRNIDHSKYVALNIDPSQYEEMVSLGLGDFYRSLGITENWQAGSNTGDTYFKLGLVEMGLLGRAFIDDPQAVTEAKQNYSNGNYSNEAFRIINAGAVESNAQFANNWGTFETQAPLNFTQNITLGDQLTLFGKKFGYLAGIRYGSSVKYDPNSTIFRTLTSELSTEGEPSIDVGFDQEIVNYENGWTGLINTNLKLNSNNSISLLFMPNKKGTNKIRSGVDTYASSTYKFGYAESQFYEERSQLVYQFKSKHFIPEIKTKINAYASYTDGDSSAPDFKDIRYFSDDGQLFVFDKTVSNPRRNFRELNEDVLDTRLSIELPIKEKAGNISKLKFGGAYLDKQREFNQFDYLLRLSQGTVAEFNERDLNAFFTDDKFGFVEDSEGRVSVPLYYRSFDDPANNVIGHSKVYAGFLMADQTITSRLRMSGGLRVEYTDIFSDVKEFAELGYATDDERRKSPDQSFVLTPGDKNQLDYLPSLNILYNLRNDDLAPINLRLNYSKTIARPSVREYTETVVRDFELNADVFGNAELEIVRIDNLDLRFESYFKSGDNISVSLFYKNFLNHIELLSSNLGFTWANADESYVYGIEIEGKKKLWKKLEFRTNVSLVNSFTRIEDRRLEIMDGIKSWIPLGIVERTMFGQAPFVVNGIISYSNDEIGFNSSVSYNLQGPKLVLTSIDNAPDVYEMPRHLLNFKLSKSFFKYFGVSFTVRNILNAPIRRAYNFDGEYQLDFDRFTFGTNYNLSLSYKL